MERGLQPKGILLVVAAPAEARAIINHATPHIDVPPQWTRISLAHDLALVTTGIGKVNAAAAVALRFDPAIDATVLSVGVAGALPGSDLPIGSRVLASESVYADEGIETPGGFLNCDQMGFPLGPFRHGRVPSSISVDTRWRAMFDVIGPIATVSTCSGTDQRAMEVAWRTGAVAEAMEGAAVGHVCAILGVGFAELRVISNTTGDRERQRWDLPGSLSILGKYVADVIDVIRASDRV